MFKGLLCTLTVLLSSSKAFAGHHHHSQKFLAPQEARFADGDAPAKGTVEVGQPKGNALVDGPKKEEEPTKDEDQPPTTGNAFVKGKDEPPSNFDNVCAYEFVPGDLRKGVYSCLHQQQSALDQYNKVLKPMLEEHTKKNNIFPNLDMTNSEEEELSCVSIESSTTGIDLNRTYQFCASKKWCERLRAQIKFEPVNDEAAKDVPPIPKKDENGNPILVPKAKSDRAAHGSPEEGQEPNAASAPAKIPGVAEPAATTRFLSTSVSVAEEPTTTYDVTCTDTMQYHEVKPEKECPKCKGAGAAAVPMFALVAVTWFTSVFVLHV